MSREKSFKSRGKKNGELMEELRTNAAQGWKGGLQGIGLGTGKKRRKV